MKEDAQNKLLEAMRGQLDDLLVSNGPQIFETYEEAIKEHDSDKKFKFPISLKVNVQGDDPETYEVESTIAFKVNRKDSRDQLVKTGEDMVDQMNKSEAKKKAPAKKKDEKGDNVVDL